jgi:aldehyde dehydrogenase (NAD+)
LNPSPFETSFADAVAAQRAFFDAGNTRSLEFRQSQLQRLVSTIESNEAAIIEAVRQDLGRPEQDTLFSEVMLAAQEGKFALKYLKRWMAEERRSIPWLSFPGRAVVRREPFGLSCIIGPWNYPFYLVFAPLVGSIAGGNCTIIKASEYTPNSSRLLKEIVSRTFAPEYITVVEGDKTIGESLLKEKFDFIFFTGGTEAGRAVMQAAARQLTPLVLELGGKSPCLVLADVEPEKIAKRIVWGKFLNAGQTCVAPDYVLVHESRHDDLVKAMDKAVAEFYPNGCGKIVSSRHLQRLVPFLKDGRVICGGNYDLAHLTFEPTLLADVDIGSSVMREEIFGPILPVIAFREREEALAIIQRNPSPLAFYLFSLDPTQQKYWTSQVRSGGVCINDIIMHMIGCRLPFGGVGASGFGSYHGHDSFRAFTQQRSILTRPLWFDPSVRYPSAKISLSLARRLYRFLIRG